MILTFGNKIITSSQDKFICPPVYDVFVTAQHGSVTATPNKGSFGTEVTLSNTPDTGYEFGSYSLTGSSLKNSNQFDIQNTNVYVVGTFNGIQRTITCSGVNGSVTATPSAGIIGTTVTLSNTPNSGYEFESYSVTGATLINSNQFVIGESDVTVVGTFQNTLPFNTVTIGNRVWAKEDLRLDDGQGGITLVDTYSTTDGSHIIGATYTIAAAQRIVASVPGWRIPTSSDWNNLFSNVGGVSTAGKMLKSTYGWQNRTSTPGSGNGIDAYGWTGLPYIKDGNNWRFYNSYWHCIPVGSSVATGWYLSWSNDKAAYTTSTSSSRTYHLRLVKDA